MRANCGLVGPVPLCPTVGRYTGIYKIQAVSSHSDPFQDQLGRDHALSVGLTVNRTILHRRELVGCADDLVNRIGKTWAVYTVHDDRAYSQLSIQRLIPTLSVDDMGQPVEGIAVVVTLT